MRFAAAALRFYRFGDFFVSGGEDLFEFLDEAGAGERVPTAPVVAAAPVVQTAPAIESCEPPGYMLPLFFPFGKPEPTAPQLKLSGVSSFKKINRYGRWQFVIRCCLLPAACCVHTTNFAVSTCGAWPALVASVVTYCRTLVRPLAGIYPLFTCAASIKRLALLACSPVSLVVTRDYVFGHSRLLQGGALSDREEADAIRELEVRY